jgi:Ca-activated chloride channel family protein
MLLSSCGAIPGLAKHVTVTILYGSEKQAWLTPLVDQYNAENHKTADGSIVVVKATAIGSIESINAILSGSIQATVWSPASTVYLPIAKSEWSKSHSTELYTQEPKELVISPVVIAMWEPMARALGWPDKSLGWADIAGLATDPKGWAGYGYPEWGNFKFGHTHPDYSNSGFVSIIAEAYAAAGKQHGLTADDLNSPQAQDFMRQVESSIIHYGTSTGFFADRMFQRGPSYLSAAVMYENLVANQETARLSGQSSQLPVVAIYPREGTFMANHPYVILNAPWVTAAQAEAAGLFRDFLLAKPQQIKALALGFRPSDPSLPLSAPLDAQHGVDVTQPMTVLEVPSAEVMNGISSLWEQTKKPVDLEVVMDISGSMEGDKITSARSSLLKFVNLLSDRDSLRVVIFSDNIVPLTDLSPLGPKRQDLLNRISGVSEGGNTRLYDAVASSYQDLTANGDPGHIRAMIVLTDGQDNQSSSSLQDVLDQLDAGSQEGGNAIKLFTIGFGSDADTGVLKQMSDVTGGKEYDSDPSNIQTIYDDIATFF